MTAKSNPAGDLTHSAELLWEGRERPDRGPRPALTLDRIVEVAVTVADGEGMGGLSMRRVARELGVGTMSLYRYVPTKAVLLDLMLDRVSDLSEQIVQARGLDRRGRLEVAARCRYRVYRAHPWLLQVNWARPPVGPHTLAGVELIVAALDGAGLTDQERVKVLMLLEGYCVGVARQQIQYATAARDTRVSDEDYWTTQQPVLEKALASDRFPATASLAEDAFGAGWEETFEFGLRRLLDGVEALIASRSAGVPHPA